MRATPSWREVPIKELYLGLYDGPHATPKPSEEGPVFLGIGNLTDDGHLSLSDIRHIAEADFSRWTQRVEPRAGDIVFTYEATLNRYAIIPPGFRGCLGRRLALIRPNPEAVDTRYLFYYFFSPRWRSLVANKTLSGATVDRIPLTDFPSFPVLIPDLPTQTGIARILGGFDALIENNLRRIRILEQMARAIYREWFVDFRFPGHERVALVDSPLGPIPKGWKGRLGDLLTLEREGVDPGDTPEERFEHFSIPAFDDGQFPIEELGAGIRSTKYLLDSECVLLSKLNPRIPRVWRPRPSGSLRAITSTEFLVLRPRVPAARDFIFATCVSAEFTERFVALSIGTSTSHQRVKPQELLGFSVITPPVSIIESFATTVGPMYDLIQIRRMQSAALRQTRDLLLPRLMSGQLTIPEAEPSLQA